MRAAAEALEGEQPVDARRKERLQRVLADASRRMEGVVDRFLDLARAEAGLPGAVREPVPLGELVRAVVAAAEADPRYASRRFSVRGDAPPIRGVAERLETAVRNLVHNAAEYAGDGGAVEVAITADAGGGVTLAVRDSGPGIPEADRERVFDRYFTTRPGGTGIGLALTKAILEAHGGSVDARSPGGAEFVVRLPASAPEPGAG